MILGVSLIAFGTISLIALARGSGHAPEAYEDENGLSIIRSVDSPALQGNKKLSSPRLRIPLFAAKV